MYYIENEHVKKELADEGFRSAFQKQVCCGKLDLMPKRLRGEI